jgi:hypothetical protein
LQKAKTGVVVLPDDSNPEEIRNTPVPNEGNIHAKPGAEFAPAMTQFLKAGISIDLVISPDLTQIQHKGKINQINKLLADNDLIADILTVIDPGLLPGILK